MSKNYYELLGVKPGVSLTEIKRSYRKLARKYHPDSGAADSSEELFHAITSAYDTLSNPDKRLLYDRLHGFAEDSSENDEFTNGQEQSTASAKKQTEGAQAYKRQKPSRGSFGAKNEKLQSTSHAGPNSTRFSTGGQHDLDLPPTRRESILSRLSNFVRPSSGRTPAPTRNVRPNKSADARNENPDIRGPREYYFTIDALESIRGTTREIALKSDDGTPRVIRVKIPANIRPGASLKVPLSESETARIHVNVVPHPFVSRENDDVTVRVPLTLLEALNGADIEVPSPQGPVRVRIPPKTADDKKLRVKGRGIKAGASDTAGDLYVDTYIVLPTSLSTVAKQAAQALEAHYNTDVRKDLPRQLN